MNYSDILNSKYFIEIYTKIEEMKKDYPVNHGFIHINNVIRNAKRLVNIFLDNEDESNDNEASITENEHGLEAFKNLKMIKEVDGELGYIYLDLSPQIMSDECLTFLRKAKKYLTGIQVQYFDLTREDKAEIEDIN